MSTQELLATPEQTPTQQLAETLKLPTEYSLRGSFSSRVGEWSEVGSLALATGAIARTACLGVASQFVTPKHIELSDKIMPIHPASERAINQADYKISHLIDNEHRTEIELGLDEKRLGVTPVFGIWNGQPDEFAFLLPGRGVVFDKREEERVSTVLEEQKAKAADYIWELKNKHGINKIQNVLRHIYLTVKDEERMSNSSLL